MEHNGGNQNLPTTLCRTGCGFYANAAFEGMCSKCYKDIVKRKQQNPSPTQVAGRASPTVNIASDLSTTTESMTSMSVAGPSIETGSPTVPSVCATDKTSTGESTDGATASAKDATSTAEGNDDSSDKEKKPKKNRCHTCKKKVGLTGFQCRCGGLYCSMHRYSDKHECTFDYKEMAQNQIRKNNPVVVGQKIQKI